jgi:uncharacterized protein (DUF736 family)
MSGALFINSKEGNEARPDFKGKITLDDGKVLRVSAWKAVSQAGQPYLSCKCDWVDSQNNAAVAGVWDVIDMGTNQAKPVVEVEKVDDNIPF